MEIVFKKEKVATRIIFSEYFMDEVKAELGKEGLDYMHETVTGNFQAWILTRLEGTRKITVYHKRPTFLQWLLRKPISIQVEVNCKEIFKNPPQIPNNEFIYEIKQL